VDRVDAHRYRSVVGLSHGATVPHCRKQVSAVCARVARNVSRSRHRAQPQRHAARRQPAVCRQQRRALQPCSEATVVYTAEGRSAGREAERRGASVAMKRTRDAQPLWRCEYKPRAGSGDGGTNACHGSVTSEERFTRRRHSGAETAVHAVRHMQRVCKRALKPHRREAPRSSHVPKRRRRRRLPSEAAAAARMRPPSAAPARSARSPAGGTAPVSRLPRTRRVPRRR